MKTLILVYVILLIYVAVKVIQWIRYEIEYYRYERKHFKNKFE